MPRRIADALSLIRAIASLLEGESAFLAAPDEASFFRKGYQKPMPAIVEIAPPRPSLSNKPLPIAPPPPAEKVLEPVAPPPCGPKSAVLPPVSVVVEIQATHFAPLSLKALFAKIAPEVSVLDAIPNDAGAKRNSALWKTKNQTAPITILSFSEPEPQRILLEAIAKALDVYFGPARLVDAKEIEKEKQWEAFLSVEDLKLVIACDYTLWQLSGLMSFYKENSTDGTRVLGKTPLFLLPDLSLYLKDPLLKRFLWKALCLKLSS